MMGFKNIIAADAVNVFMNPEEFGEAHQVNDKKMQIIIDNNEMVEREKRQRNNVDYRDGVFKREVLFYVLRRDFGPLPKPGTRLQLDGHAYFVTDAIDESGIYSVSLMANRSQ